METGQHDLYMLTTSDPVEFTTADLAACVGLIGGGGAVNPASSERELPLATYVTVVRAEGQVVGVGAIKRIRPDYTSKVAIRSGAPIDPGTPELGYVSVSAEHQGSPAFCPRRSRIGGASFWAAVRDDRQRAHEVNAEENWICADRSRMARRTR